MATPASAPIALFVYNRPEHVRRTVESLLTNAEAAGSELFVFCDGARTSQAEEAVRQTREVVRGISGFAAVTVVERERNFGLAKSITGGVSEICASHGRVIVLEDDLVLSPHFLRYMNEGLALYADAPEVASIHGYVYPLNVELPETFFLRGADCWGWATWARAWQAFEPDAARLLAQLEERGLVEEFDLEGAGPYMQMLRGFIEGKNDSWAVRWHASAFLRGMLTLYPGRSLVRNIGNDGSGEHCDDVDVYQSELARAPVRMQPIELRENAVARAAFRRFFLASRPRLSERLSRRLRDVARRLRSA